MARLQAKEKAPDIILRRGKAQAREERKGVLRQLVIMGAIVVAFFVGSSAYQSASKYFADMSPTGRMLQGLPTFTPVSNVGVGVGGSLVVPGALPGTPGYVAPVVGSPTVVPGVVIMPSPQAGGSVATPGLWGGNPGYPHGTPTKGSSP